MKSTASVKLIYGFISTYKVSVGIIALACAVPLSLAANASEQKKSGHGEPAPAHKASTAPAHKPDASNKAEAAPDHSSTGSRVFGARKSPKLAAASAHGEPKQASPAGHGVKKVSSSHSKKTAATSQGTIPAVSHGADAAPKPMGSHPSLWAYTGNTGPSHWGGLKSEYAACGEGKMQSPINISGGLPVKASRIKFNYKLTELTIRNNGRTIQVDYKKGSHMVVNGHRYDLLKFQFHTPSEHLINGKKYPAEMHLVHKDAHGALAVVAVMMEQGEKNIAFAEVVAHLPEQAGKPAHIGGVAINARDLLPENGSYSHYKGSLTTPPCSEGVNWFVLSKPVEVSTAQIRTFSEIMGENARPAQSTHNRLVISEK